MKIKLKLVPSTTRPKEVTITLEELGFTEKDWVEMSEEDRADEIYAAINGFDDLVWEVESTETIE